MLNNLEFRRSRGLIHLPRFLTLGRAKCGWSQVEICRAEKLRYMQVRSLDGQESESRP